MFADFKDPFITHIDKAFKLNTHFDESITKAFVLMAGARVRLLSRVKNFEAEMYNQRENITKYIEKSGAGVDLRLMAMQMYAMLGEELP